MRIDRPHHGSHDNEHHARTNPLQPEAAPLVGFIIMSNPCFSVAQFYGQGRSISALHPSGTGSNLLISQHDP